LVTARRSPGSLRRWSRCPVGIWGAATGASIAVGPIVGGLLVEHVTCESVFYINALIAVAALLIGAITIVESAAALAPWLEHYNTQRRHSALGGLPPISRLRPTS
jgi:MFS family permease